MYKILVVDDEEDVQQLARIILESEGYMVLTASSGEETLNILSHSKPDLVLLDVVLPGISGLDICRQMKRDKNMRDIPVIMFTALGSGVDMMLSKQEKADDYILKPFTRKMLLEKVERLLHR